MLDPTARLTDTDRSRLQHLVKLGLDLRAFFDVGASTGGWSERMSEDFPNASFDLFEPLVELAPNYRLGMEAVLALHPGFRVHKFALGPETKRTSMCFYPNNLVGSTALELEALPAGACWETVEMLTLDYAVQEFRLPVPQVIKIDTQGCELGILQGARATLPDVQVLLLECWLARRYGKHTPLLFEIADWLRANDFYLWDLGNGWRNADGTLMAQDCFFLNARSPITRLKHEASRTQRGCSMETQAARGPAWFQRMTDKLWHP